MYGELQSKEKQLKNTKQEDYDLITEESENEDQTPKQIQNIPNALRNHFFIQNPLGEIDDLDDEIEQDEDQNEENDDQI